MASTLPGGEITDNKFGANSSVDLNFGNMLYLQEQLIESLKTPIGAADPVTVPGTRAGGNIHAIGCVRLGGTMDAGGGGATYDGSNGTSGPTFKSAGNATRVAYFYMPNLSLQEAAALSTKVNGPFEAGALTQTGDLGPVTYSTVGQSPSNGANAWFTSAASGNPGEYDAYIYVAHQ